MEMLIRAWTLLRHKRDFGLLMATQFCALAGDGLVQTALAKLIVFGGQRGFDLEGARDPEELLRIALLVFMPYTVVSPFLGVVIDRWDRRRLLFLANGFRAVVLALVGLAGVDAVRGALGDVTLFLAFLLTLMSTRVVLATKSAALPATLDERSLVEGNAISQFGGALFQLGGAGIALVAAGFIPVGPIVVVGALVYAIGAAFAWMIARPGEARSSDTFAHEVARVAANIARGVATVARTPKAGASITTYFWLRFLWSFSLVGIGFVARELLAGDDMAVAVVTGGAGAAGAALGFLSAVRLLSRVRTTAHLVLAGSVVGGVAVAVLGGLQVAASLALLAFFLGLGFFVAKISLDTMVQEALGDDFRGRAFSLYDIAYNVAWVLAAAVMKLLWTEGVAGALFFASGIVFLAGIAAIGLWFRRAGLLEPAISVEEVRL